MNLLNRVFLLLCFFLVDTIFAGPPTYIVAPDMIGRQSIAHGNDNDDDLNAPLVSVSFSHLDNGQGQLYARLYSQGTSGQFFEYFILQRGKFNKLGLYPEISYDDEEDVFFSLEKDGQRILRTIYSFKNNKFKRVSSEIHGGVNDSSH